MDAFTTHTGTAAPLRRTNVDTDQIIPAEYLKRITRTGFEDGLFIAWRTNEPDFVLNRPEYAGASSATSQSARTPGSCSARAPGVGAAGPRASVVTGAPAARAMATPQRGPSPPSSVMMAWSVRTGSNRPALAAKYSCIEPCMSRWSWVRLVNPATA